MARLGMSLLAVVWLVGCGDAPPRPTPLAPPASSERPPDPRKLLLGDGVPRDRDRALALYNAACQRGDARSCGIVAAAPGVAAERHAAADDMLWRRCQTGEVRSCRIAAHDTPAFSGPEAAVRAACEGGFAYACTALAIRTSDAALLARACRLGDPAACFEAGKSDPQQVEQGMAILGRNCDAGVALDCLNIAKRADPGDVQAHAARRALELAVRGCLAADLTACRLAQGETEPTTDVEIRRMACAIEPGNCQTLAQLQLAANDAEGARRTYELSCLTDVPHYHYEWRASDCLAGAKLFLDTGGAARPDSARAAAMTQKACALGDEHACGARAP